jgi:hypothetical protein
MFIISSSYKRKIKHCFRTCVIILHVFYVAFHWIIVTFTVYKKALPSKDVKVDKKPSLENDRVDKSHPVKMSGRIKSPLAKITGRTKALPRQIHICG